ncbi:uncharacterized protein L203_101752 [Cryptococcus depauperatus CBS 7841]|uniref:Major facilitator superfamily (MFS) profile domain-containing protein n=1 Tax=Cryptococcus depauperatus CBS 7841 TaxID=1295531 RepID=A0AAJ8JQE6_9TREE
MPLEVYDWRLYIAILLISWGSITFGWDGAIMGTTIARSSFKQYFGIDHLSPRAYADISSNVASCCKIAAFLVLLSLGCPWDLLATCPPQDLDFIDTEGSLCGLAVGGTTGVVNSLSRVSEDD